MGYEIRIVSDEEFDSLPYLGARGSFGLADAKNGIAYVRQTGVRDLDEATISHEFDELLMSVSPHEEDGIRYKSGKSLGQWLAPVLGAVLAPFTAGTSLAWVPAIAGAALGAGTAIHSSSVKPEKYGPVSFGNIALPAATGALGGFGGGQAMTGAMAGASAAKEAGTSQLIGGLKGAVGMGTSAAPATGAAKLSTNLPLSSADLAASGASGAAAAGTGISGSVLPLSTKALSTGSGLLGGASAGTNLMTAAAAPAGQSLLSKFGSFAGDTAKSMGTNLATNAVMSSLTPQAPAQEVSQQQPSLYPEQRTPASNVAPTDLYGSAGALSRFNPTLIGAADQYNPVTQQEYDLGIGNLTKAKQTRMSDIFKTPAFRGQTVAENSRLAGQISNLNTGYEKELGQYNLDIDAENLSREYNAIKKNNNFTDAQMNEFIDLAKMDDAAISAKASNTPAEIRAIFGRLKKIA